MRSNHYWAGYVRQILAVLLDVVIGEIVSRCCVLLNFRTLATQEESKVAVGSVDVATTTKQGSEYGTFTDLFRRNRHKYGCPK